MAATCLVNMVGGVPVGAACAIKLPLLDEKDQVPQWHSEAAGKPAYGSRPELALQMLGRSFSQAARPPEPG